jgi:archaeal flagellar protein FlaG
MDKVIVTVLLIIGGVVAAFAIMNGIYPALQRSSSAINTATDKVNDQIKSQIEIINVSTNGTNVQVWVKNVGASMISSIEDSDVFLYSGSNVDRLTYGDETTPLPYWNYGLTGNSTSWGPAVTNQFRLFPAALAGGPYKVKVVIPNGIFDETTFGE